MLTAYVDCVVIIDNNGLATTEGIDNPNIEPWFLVWCYSDIDNSDWPLITQDGKSFRMIFHNKLLPREEFAAVERPTINEAIENYVKERLA